MNSHSLSRSLAKTLALATLLTACDDRIVPTAAELEVCGPYPAAASSPYQLPIPVGESTTVIQGNCSTFSHSGGNRYAFDFTRGEGQTVVAVRAGVVTALEESHADNQENALNEANFVQVVHGDGTVGYYVHLMEDGVLVEMGENVSAGQPIGLVGLTGFTTGPHLHFEVLGCESGCGSIAITFNNASPTDEGGLVLGRRYTALPPGSGGLSLEGEESVTEPPGAGPGVTTGPGVERPAPARRPVVR